MEPAHYIIFHPDYQRQCVTVNATALRGGKPLRAWTGNIYVDCVGGSNEDPFVFNDPWIYSYCHASQLRRTVRRDSYLQKGSVLIFASGQEAEKKMLCIDTVFVIGDTHRWGKKPLDLPVKYRSHYRSSRSALWQRHFQFPFEGIHASVSHTYEAELWAANKTEYSFLPLDGKNNRISIPFEEMETGLRKKVAGKVKGKYPVLLSGSEIQQVRKLIEQITVTKVAKDITTSLPVVSKRGVCGGPDVSCN